MKRRFLPLLALIAALILPALACSPSTIGQKTVTITILYGSEKKDWLEAAKDQYNSEQHKTADGSVIVVETTAMGSIESMNAILSGESQPTVWSPASDIYIPLANAEWRRSHSDDLVSGTPQQLVLSPVVIAMWKPMAEALGWPQKQLGWADIASLATSEKGWEDYGYPEWGTFKFGHTHPEYSNSGLVSVIAEAYAGAEKERGLSLDDLQDDKTRDLMINVEKSIIHYGASTGFFADRMFERGPSYLSAAVMYENLIVVQESKRINGQSSQLPVVAIYPKEGTFWSNHPYAILNASWVTDEQRTAAQDFLTYLRDKPQQEKALALGFRPADPAVALGFPLDTDHGVDIGQPKTVLEVPPADVINGVRDLWKQVKKPVDIVAVLDISGSMEGDKISTARSSLIDFINLLDDRDSLEVMLFSDKVDVLSPMTPLAQNRNDLTTRVSGIFEHGDTRLYDAVDQAYKDVQATGDPTHIRAVVVLTDGEDTASNTPLDAVVREIGNTSEGGNAIKVFTIAFGSDANTDVLKQIAEATGAKMYEATPETIKAIYTEIATFF